jgi:hypothetical protein
MLSWQLIITIDGNSMGALNFSCSSVKVISEVLLVSQVIDFAPILFQLIGKPFLISHRLAFLFFLFFLTTKQ